MSLRSFGISAVLAILVALPPLLPALAAPEGGEDSPEAVFDCPVWRDNPLDTSMVPLLQARPALPRGTLKVLMLCVEFTNVKHQGVHTPAHHDGLADGPSNSMDLYYQQVSHGLVRVQSDCFGWYSSSQTMETYGDPSGGEKDNPQLYKLVTEAVNLADPALDFASYDGDGDGWVDYLMIVHAGNDEAVTGNAGEIWSHKYWNFDQPSVDGKNIGWYSMVSEFSPMGVLAHEFGHQLGLPDLYDTDGPGSGGETDGAGWWDIMAAGSFLNDGNSPAFPSAWCRALLGWASVVNITQNAEGLELPAAELCSTVLRVNVPGLPNEYFLLENRRNLGYDTYLPGSGLLIWHVDESKGGLDTNDLEVRPGRKRVNLEEAHGGTQDLDTADGNLGDSRDPWFGNPGGFTPTSDPNSSALFDGRPSFISVHDISSASALMTLSVKLNTHVYDLRLMPSAAAVNVDPGAAGQYTVELQNRGSAENYTFLVEGPNQGWFSTEPPHLTIPQSGAATVTVVIRPPAFTPAGTTFKSTFKARAAADLSQYFMTDVTVKVNTRYRSSVAPSQDIFLLAGERRTIELTVRNLGNVADTVTVSFTGPGTSWTEYDGPPSVALAPGANATVRLTASIPWGTEENSRTYMVAGGRSKDGSASISATLNLTASPSHLLFLSSPAELLARPASAAQWPIGLVNAGPSILELSLSCSAPPGWSAVASRPELTLPPYADEELSVAVSPPPRAPAGTTVTVVLEAATPGYSNSTSVAVTVEQVFGARLENATLMNEIPAGEDFEHRLRIENSGNGLDELRLALSGEAPEGWSRALYAESARLRPDEALDAVLIVSAPAGAPAGQEMDLGLSVRHGDGNATSFDLVYRVMRAWDIRLTAKASSKAADPGSSAQFSLVLVNGGNAPDTVRLTATRPEGVRCELSQAGVDLQPGASAEITLTCRVDAGALAGTRSIDLTAVPEGNASADTVLELRLVIAAVFGSRLSTQEAKKECAAGKSVVFQFTLENEGNSPDTFTLSKSGGTLPASFDRASLALGPGERASVNLTVSVPGGEGGGDRVLKLTVRSQGKGADVETEEVTVRVKAAGGGKSMGFEGLMVIASILVIHHFYYRGKP